MSIRIQRIFLLSLLICLTLSLKVTQHKQNYGGWDISPANNEIDNFIRQSLPGLNGAELVETKTQTVSGTNYLYTYRRGDTFWKVQVF